MTRFDIIVEQRSVPYLSDTPAPIEALYVYLHLISTQLFRVYNMQGYSDKTRENLEKALKTYNRYQRASSNKPEILLPLEYSISLEAVASSTDSDKTQPFWACRLMVSSNLFLLQLFRTSYRLILI